MSSLFRIATRVAGRHVSSFFLPHQSVGVKAGTTQALRICYRTTSSSKKHGDNTKKDTTSNGDDNDNSTFADIELESSRGFKVGMMDEDDVAVEEEKARRQRIAFQETDIDPSEYTKEIKLIMPDMDESISGGKVVKWHKKEGDIVYWNDALCDVDFDSFSFTMVTEDEFPSILGKILHEASDTKIVPVGETLCFMWHKETYLNEEDKKSDQEHEKNTSKK